MRRDSARPIQQALALAIAWLAALPVLAIDPGVATGNLEVDGRVIALTRAYVLERVPAGNTGMRREMRVLLADRDVPQSMLAGADLAALEEKARSGALQAVLIVIDPAAPAGPARGVLLVAEKDSVRPLATFSGSGADGGIAALRIGGNRVRGEARRTMRDGSPAFGYSVAFDAPHYREALRADPAVTKTPR